MDIAEIRKRKQPNTRSVSILLEPDLRLEYDQVESLFRKAKDPDTADRLRSELDELEAKIEAATATFRFRALSRRRWQELVDEHPPKDEDEAKLLGFSLEEIAPVLLVEAAVDPELGRSDVEAILDDDAWGEAETTALIAAAIAVNREVRNVPKGRS